MLRIFIITSTVLLIAGCRQEGSVIPYPPVPEADSIRSFLPGIVCSGGDSVDFNAAFGPDGKSFYFTRSLNRKWDIYVTRYQDGQWRKPVRLKFSSDQYSEADPAFGPDGTLYFISDLPKNEADTLRDFDIWFVKPLSDGTWTKPENLEAVNTDSTEYYISFAGDGNMYFASSRVGGYGLEDIYVSYHREGRFSKPENLGPKINSSFSDHDPCLPKNESFMIYTSVDRKDGYGEGDLYFSVRDANGQWSEGELLDTTFNTPTYEYCSYFSPDHDYFFYSSRRDVKWTRVETLPEPMRSLVNRD